MKFILKSLLKVIILIIGLLLLLIFIIQAGYLDTQIATIVESILSNRSNAKVTIDDMHIHHLNISVKRITWNFDDYATSAIHDLNISFNLKEIVNNYNATLNADIKHLVIFNKDQEQILDANVSVNHAFDLKNLSSNTIIELNDITLNILNSINNKNNNLTKETAKCNYYKKFNVNNVEGNCVMNFLNESHLSLNFAYDTNLLKINTDVQSIPIHSYKILEKFLPNNKVIEFMNTHITSGNIIDGHFTLLLDKEFFDTKELLPTNLFGNLKVSDLEVKYDNKFPLLKNMELEIELSGKLTKFFINKCYTSDTLISDGIITLNWTGYDTTDVIVNAVASGPIVDLTDFMTSESLKHLKLKNIDLRKIEGTANSTINIVIPINQDRQNLYNISTVIDNANLSIFHDKIYLNHINLTGVFDGEQIAIKGHSKINGFDSDIKYVYQLATQTQSDKNQLNIKSYIKNINTNIGIIQLLSGNALVNLEYLRSSDKPDGQITINSDLKDIAFDLHRIGINKPSGSKANLHVDYLIGNTLNNDNISLQLIGDNNLRIICNAKIQDQNIIIDLPNITHGNTDITSHLIFTKNRVDAKVIGNTLDLSQTEMQQFLSKTQDNVNTKIKVDINRVILKNNIALNDVLLKIKCNEKSCFKGYLDSKIGKRFLKMILNQLDNDKERWVITSNNAGAVLKGFNIYEHMKFGNMLIIINANRNKVQKGEFIPIIDGIFNLKKFTLTNTPFLTKIISFISIPGIISTITNNHDIKFIEMNGKFNYYDNIVNIIESSANGPFFDFTMLGKINTKERSIKLNGQVIPSIYNLNKLMTYFPVIGWILSGNKSQGIAFAPYSIEQNY